MIGFRLADSLPAEALRRLEQDLLFKTEGQRREYIKEILDAGHGECLLGDPRIATIVQNAFLFFDNQRYRLIAWVIMPNHVHVLVEMFDGFPLANIVQAWKGFTAREANKLLGRSDKFWQRDYFDRYIRDEAHYIDAVNYIHLNPVKAGLVERPEDWPYSSAGFERMPPGKAAHPE